LIFCHSPNPAGTGECRHCISVGRGKAVACIVSRDRKGIWELYQRWRGNAVFCSAVKAKIPLNLIPHSIP